MELSAWIGRTESAQDVVTATPIAALAATLDRPPTGEGPASILPELWHWLFFLPTAQRSKIGPDGHPRRGTFLPPVAQPRRMWAGSQIEFHKPLHVGDAITRESSIEKISEKTGKSGPLTFVRVKHVVSAGEGAALTEFQDIVYRDPPTTAVPGSSGQTVPDKAQWIRRIDPDEVLLFRFSALTFNSHRIHYDRSYATGEEGYPGLVVHGPLVAVLLLDALRAEMNNPRLASFQFRSVRPIFDTTDFVVCGEPDADGKTIHLWAQDHDGYLAMDATAVLR